MIYRYQIFKLIIEYQKQKSDVFGIDSQNNKPFAKIFYDKDILKYIIYYSILHSDRMTMYFILLI